MVCVLTFLTHTSLEAAPPQKRGVQITPKAAPVLESPYKQSYAVIIGINAYDKLPSLDYAVKDARAMEEKLKSLGFQTTTLLNQHATRDKILKILGDELPQKVQTNDRVIVFFAGHTQTEEMADGTHMGYLVPVDADTKNIVNTAISMDQIRGFSRRLQAKHALYLIDSAFAGLRLTKSGTIPPSERDYLQKVSTSRAHQILTAGGKGELVHLEHGGLGVFTEYVLEALDGSADRDGKGFITFSDIASYVKPKVSRFTGTKQVPQYGNIEGDGEFVFVLAGLPAAHKAAAPGLAAPQAPMDEKARLAEEQKRLDEEKRRNAEEQARLRQEKEELDRQIKEAQREAAARKEADRKGLTTAMVMPPSVPALGVSGRDGRFIASGDGTVLDTRTNLMWAAKDNGANISWQDAKSYCENYRGGGYKDWRMPTQDELAELYDTTITNTNPPAEGCNGGYHLTNLIHLTCCCPWASETRGSTAANFGFSNGPRHWLDQSYVGSIRALPVRSTR
jgi:Sec-independent protein translocase protein TatA